MEQIVKIVDLITNPTIPGKCHPTNDEWQVDIKFRCGNCRHEYLVLGDPDAVKSQELMDSIRNGRLIKNISCPKCSPVN